MLNIRQHSNAPICFTDHIVLQPQLGHVCRNFTVGLGGNQVYKVCAIFGNKAMQQAGFCSIQSNAIRCDLVIGQSAVPHSNLTNFAGKNKTVIFPRADLHNTVCNKLTAIIFILAQLGIAYYICLGRSCHQLIIRKDGQIYLQ